MKKKINTRMPFLAPLTLWKPGPFWQHVLQCIGAAL